jgi:hypothetical protein
MNVPSLEPYRSGWQSIIPACLALIGFVLLLAGCTSGGDQGQATAPSAPSPRVERQAIDNLLALEAGEEMAIHRTYTSNGRL